MEIESYDVLVVGGGLAGIRAAIAAVEANPRARVGMVSKVYPMRSHTVSAEGGAAAVLRPEDSYENHAFDTIKGSDYLADQDVVEAFVREAPTELIQMEHWGCPWSRDPDGKISARPFGGMTTWRTCFAADKTGFHMLHSVFQTSLKYEQIHRHDEAFVTKLLVEDSRCVGVVALDQRSGRFDAITAKAVILATGGLGRVYAFTTNGNICTGDGMALGYRAGAGLKDMEMVQFHPTGLPFTGILITEAVRGEGGYLLNRDGERFLKRYVPNKMELGPRDIISRAMTTEFEEGRGFEGPHGKYMHLDVRHLGEEAIDRKLPFMRELGREYVGIDIVKDPIPVRPVQHYMMGGVDADISGATEILGLYAAGECANVGLNGGNRLGSNSLSECLVFGAASGRAAAHYAASAKPVTANPVDALLWDEARRVEVEYLEKKGGHERIGNIRFDLQREMDAGAGVFRTKRGLEKLIQELGVLRERFGQIRVEDSSRTFNTELTAALELDYMLEVSMVIAVSALAREESRGAHARRDFPERNDEKYLKHTVALKRDGGRPRLDYRDVRITNFQPQARNYSGDRRLAEKRITIQATRFDPEKDEKPRLQSYDIPFSDESMVVLDALNHIKSYVDGTLSYRWSCRMGICGSCGMMVNGTPKLTCNAFLRDYWPHKVVVEPLNNFPIIRDLIIDMEDFMHKLKSVKPWIIRKQEIPLGAGPHRQLPMQIDEFRQFSECINCMLCYAACPVYGLNDKFLGPAAIALARRYNLDSRDEGLKQRQPVIADAEGVWECSFVGECSVVCPKGVDPAKAIQQSKLDTTLRFVLPYGNRED